MTSRMRVFAASMGICAIGGVSSGCPAGCDCTAPSPSGELTAIAASTVDGDSWMGNGETTQLDSLMRVEVVLERPGLICSTAQ
jgi:hypothetical protein